jgi:hypothetical protein
VLSFNIMSLLLFICRNVPYEWINSVKANQNWLKKQGEKFFFPGGGTMFPNGVGEYIDYMEELIPGMKDGTVRTALDTGCGVSSYTQDVGIAASILKTWLWDRHSMYF